MKGLGRSPSKANKSSQRSTATLPPINDIRSPRKSVPVSHTPKLHCTTVISEQAIEAMSINNLVGGMSESRTHMAMKTPGPKTLPKIVSNTEQNTPSNNRPNAFDSKKDRHLTQSNLAGGVKNRNSHMLIRNSRVNSPMSLADTSKLYNANFSTKDINVQP